MQNAVSVCFNSNFLYPDNIYCLLYSNLSRRVYYELYYKVGYDKVVKCYTQMHLQRGIIPFDNKNAREEQYVPLSNI